MLCEFVRIYTNIYIYIYTFIYIIYIYIYIYITLRECVTGSPNVPHELNRDIIMCIWTG